MKLLVTSDWHPDKSTAGVPRFAEVERAVQETLEAAIDEKVDAYLFLGDLCDPDAGAVVFKCVALALRAASVLAANRIPSFWLAGNHDVVEDGEGSTVLEPLSVLEPGMVNVIDRPDVLPFVGKYRLLALPFTASSHHYDAGAFIDTYDEGRPLNNADVIVAGHLHLPGILPGEETLEMARGREMVYPLAHTKKCGLRLCGHYHRQQVYEGVHIPGAPCRFAFGHDEGNKPSFLICEVP